MVNGSFRSIVLAADGHFPNPSSTGMGTKFVLTSDRSLAI
jgi:hypothetical protein